MWSFDEEQLLKQDVVRLVAMIIAAIVDRIEIGENYEVHIHFKVSAEQFIRQTA